MESSDAPSVVAAIDDIKREVAELKVLVRELTRAVEGVNESTKDSTSKIVAAIVRWT